MLALGMAVMLAGLAWTAQRGGSMAGFFSLSYLLFAIPAGTARLAVACVVMQLVFVSVA